MTKKENVYWYNEKKFGFGVKSENSKSLTNHVILGELQKSQII